MRICIVDDNAMVVDALALLLRDRGHDVFTASDTNTALNLIETATLDFVVLDVELAGERGDAFASTLRARFPALPLVLTSGHATPAPGSVGMQGADVYLPKPFTPGALVEALGRAQALRREAA